MARKTDGSALMKGPLSTEPPLLIRVAIAPRAASAAVTCRLTANTADDAARGLARGDRLAQRRLGAADHGHRGAGAGERGGDRAANAAPAASHESMLARKRHMASPSGGQGNRRRTGIF